METEQGFHLDSRFEHSGYFGGVSGRQCPSCGLPLLNLVTVTHDQVLEQCGWRESCLRVLFCWRCGLAQEPFWYRLVGEHLDIIRHGMGELVPDFPYSEYPEQVPKIDFGLIPLPPGLAALQQELDEDVDWPHHLIMYLETPRHQFLGKPFVYDDRKVSCSLCGRSMRLIMTVANDIGGGYIQTDNDGVMLAVRACTDCSIVAVEQQCD